MRARKVLSGSLIFALLAIAGCSNSWEQVTFKTLAASKAVIDQAGVDYNAAAIPQTQVNKDVIEGCQKAQIAAVEAFKEYALVKISRAPSADLNAKRKAVVDAMVNLESLYSAIEALIASVPKASLQPLPSRKPGEDEVAFAVRVIDDLRPEVTLGF